MGEVERRRWPGREERERREGGDGGGREEVQLLFHSFSKKVEERKEREK